MSTLYELTAQRLELQSKLESMDFDTETIMDTLDGESTELQAKIESYAYVIRNMDSLVDATKAEAKRIGELAKAREVHVARIKDWLLTNMQACEIKSIECPAFKISVKNNPPSVVIDNAGQIPCEYYVYPEPEPYPDKKSIAAILKTGKAVPGTHLETKQRLEIK